MKLGLSLGGKNRIHLAKTEGALPTEGVGCAKTTGVGELGTLSMAERGEAAGCWAPLEHKGHAEQHAVRPGALGEVLKRGAMCPYMQFRKTILDSGYNKRQSSCLRLVSSHRRAMCRVHLGGWSVARVRYKAGDAWVLRLLSYKTGCRGVAGGSSEGTHASALFFTEHT